MPRFKNCIGCGQAYPREKNCPFCESPKPQKVRGQPLMELGNEPWGHIIMADQKQVERMKSDPVLELLEG
jgi:hypothetical protein